MWTVEGCRSNEFNSRTFRAGVCAAAVDANAMPHHAASKRWCHEIRQFGRVFARSVTRPQDSTRNRRPVPLAREWGAWKLAGRYSSVDIVRDAKTLYGECMARLISTTVRLDEEDVRALKRARAAGHSASELVRKGLRVVASRYYKGRRPPTTRLFESTATKLGDESELFRDLEE